MPERQPTREERQTEVRDLAREAGWSHREISERLGVHRVTVSRWVNGATCIPMSRLRHLRLEVWQHLGKKLHARPTRGI